MSPGAARQVNAMMQQVVNEGTATAAALQGIDVAGQDRHGGEEHRPAASTSPGSSRFAPANDPKVAVAVTVETLDRGTGGEVAAPIAKRVMEELLR